VSDGSGTRAVYARLRTALLLTLVMIVACTRAPDKAPTTPTTTNVRSPTPGGAGLSQSTSDYRAYCGGSPACPTGSVPSTVRRLLRLPVISAGQPCPVSASRTVDQQFGPAIGAGPAYVVLPGPGGSAAILTFKYPPPANSMSAGSEYGAQKALWLTAPAYDGPVLIRGRQIDGANPIGYGTDKDPLPELQLPPVVDSANSARWRSFATEIRLRAAGCYAWQVDGTTFSFIIIFTAVISNG
jgi:hypothetical protein